MLKKSWFLVGMLLVSGCTSSNEYGRCIGVNSKKDPKLEYEYSGWNISIGLLFAAFVFPPVMVALNELQCPVGPAVGASVATK